MSVISCFFRVGFAALFLTACGSPGPPVTDDLDPVTGVTSTRTTQPIVLFRDNSALAAHARDYVYIGPVEINRMGSYTYFLWLGIWSTHHDRDVSSQRDGFESIVLFVDGEPLGLDLAGWTHSSIGISEPLYPKPVSTSADAYYAVTLDQIRLIAQSSELRLQTGGFDAASYEPWDNPARAVSGVKAFLEAVSY